VDKLIFVHKNWPFNLWISCLKHIDVAFACEVEVAAPNSLKDSSASPKMEISKEEGVGVCFLACSASKVKGCVKAPRWGLGQVTSKSIIHTNLQKSTKKLVSAWLELFGTWTNHEP
jgi:hypothetical protein